MSASALMLGLTIYLANPSVISAGGVKNKTPEKSSEESLDGFPALP